MISEEMIRDLISQAVAARRNSYSPYSHYQVGAALLSEDGRVIVGCNIENAAYTPTICAERTAFFKAVSKGIRNFTAIAVVGSPAGEEISQFAYPCGVCRQVMMEFCNPKTFLIVVAKSTEAYRCMTLEECLPDGFGPDNLE